MSNSVIKLLNTGANFLSNYCKIVSRSNCPRSIFTTATVFQHDSKDKFDWLKYNDKIYPPQDPSEERRPAVNDFPNKSQKNALKKALK